MKHYIEYTKTIIEVYEVEAKTIEEAKILVQENNNPYAPNIIDRKETETYRGVSGLYENGKLKEVYKDFYK